MFIILGPFGTPIDLVSAVIDNTDTDIGTDGFYITFDEKRRTILGGDISDPTRDFFKEISEVPYKAVCASIHKKMIERKTNIHTYISVDCIDTKAYEWCYNRMVNILPDFHTSGIRMKTDSVMHNYYSNHSIKVADILEGRMITKLQEIVDGPLDEKLYEAWLTLVHHDYPWN